ncbi:MAG TPA: hypothetical protein VMW28_08920 [Pelolinea sp.]|nr:hypothetical protein [Pelolinea sp.]
MNRSKLITGIILITVAAILLALFFALPTDKMVFMIGDENLPYVQAIVLGVVGVVMLADAAKKPQEENSDNISGKAILEIDEEKAALNKKLESVAWGLFLIMLGGFAFVPEETLPKGA